MAVVTKGASPEENPNESAKPTIRTAPVIGRLTEMFGRLASHGAWSGDSADYLDKIKKVLIDPSKTTNISMKYLTDDAVAFTTENLGVVLVREDMPNLHMLANDVRLHKAKQAFYGTYPKGRLLNIVTINRYMYNRSGQMAAYINQLFLSRLDPAAKEFTVNSFDNAFKIVIDAEMANVRQFFDNCSPAPTVAGDFGFIASTSAVNADTRQGYAVDQSPMFAVTGNVEFVLEERTQTFTPMVRVTDICSVLNNPKILALVLPLIAEVFINRGLWRIPFTALGTKDVNIGNLIVDPTSPNQKLVEVANEMGMQKFFQHHINAPILCIDIRAGHTNIPGLETITRREDHNLLLGELCEFLQTSELPSVVGENCLKEISGILETSRSARTTNLIDTRDITYLNMVAWNKVKVYDPKFDMLKTRYEIEPTRRWEALSSLVGEMTPTHSCIVSVLYGDFVRAMANVIGSKINIQLPGLSAQQAMSLTGLAGKAYSAGVPMFGGGSSMNMGQGFIRYT